MIIDPLSFMSLEMDRHRAVAEAAQAARRARQDTARLRPRRARRRGLVVRLAVWATGRAVHA